MDPFSKPRAASMILGVGAALTASALLVRYRTRKTEGENPPSGTFLEIGGVRLHYIERGHGEPLVLLHGNGTMIDDMTLSGLVDLAAKRYRVIVFDRPGFGHSERPSEIAWTRRRRRACCATLSAGSASSGQSCSGTP